MELIKLINYLNDILKAKRYNDDRKSNMLIVEGKPEVNKVALAVSSSWETLEKAKSKRIDLLIVHHRMWRDLDPEFFQKKIDFLKKNKISFYGAHESMDCKSNYGMNDSIAKELKINIEGRFAKDTFGFVGVYGETKLTLDKFLKSLQKCFHNHIQVFKFSQRFGKIGIISGNGGRSKWLYEAKKLGCDTLISGEAVYFTKLYAKESKMNLILLGHYLSESIGMKYLAHKIKKDFGLDVEFFKEENVEAMWVDSKLREK